MYGINSIKSVNNIYFRQNKEKPQHDLQTNPQNTQLPNIQPDYNVKTPINYTKAEEIDLPYNTKAHLYKLANGQKVIIVPQEGETVVKTYVNTGSMNETDNIRGISHYIEHNLFNGSQGLEEGDFFKRVDKMGASTNASTGFAQTDYYISSNLLSDSDLENKIKLHSSMLQSPLFAVEKLEKEKDIVNSEINMITSDPQNIAFNKLLKNLYDIKTNSLDMIGGTCENITNLKREDVVNYYDNNYYPANMVTVITGEIEPEETIKLISKYFTSNKQPKNPRYVEKLKPIDKQIREDIISDKATSSIIAVGFDGAQSSNAKDRVYVDALAILLANSDFSRLNTKLKSYDSYAICQDEKISTNAQNGRAIIFSAQSNEKSSEKVLKTIFNEIANISNNPPSDDEMKTVKKLLLKDYSNIIENSAVLNSALGTSLIENNIDYVKNYEKIVNEMTSQDLIDTAKKYLDVQKSSTIVVHPNSVTKEDIEKNYKDISFGANLHKKAIDMTKVKEYSFDNNYRLVTYDGKTDNTQIFYRLKTDVDFKPEAAASMVLAEILNCGNIYKNEETLKSELAKDGIEYEFSASDKTISCYVNANSDSLKSGILNIKTIIENPRFNESEFEKAKSKIKNDILLSEKSAFDKLKTEMFKGLPKGMSKDDVLKSLDKLTLDDVKLLYSDLLNHSKGIFSVCAPLDKNDELSKELYNAIATFKPIKPFTVSKKSDKFKPIDETKVLTDVDYKSQAEIITAYKYKINNNIKDDVTLKLLNIILGGNSSSRLFMDLRENQKLAYHVKSSVSNYDDIGTIVLKIGTTTDNKETGEKHFENLQKSIEGFKKHIDKMKSEKVTDEELANAKLSLKNAILNNNHSSLNKSLSLINSADSDYGTSKTDIMLDEIDKITPDDIYNAANYIFSGKPLYSILATDDTLQANKEYLQSLT